MVCDASIIRWLMGYSKAEGCCVLEAYRGDGRGIPVGGRQGVVGVAQLLLAVCEEAAHPVAIALGLAQLRAEPAAASADSMVSREKCD